MDPDTLDQRTEEMIRRRVDGGANEAESRAMLAEFLTTAGRNFLPTALHYNGFATAHAAETFTEAFFAEDPPDSQVAEQSEPGSPPRATGPDITVEHSAEGTLVHGTTRGDQVAAQALKANGFRWSRNLDAWYLPRNLTHATRDHRVASLRSALGDRIKVEIPDGGRRLTAAEKQAAKQDRAADRADRMSAKADKLEARAEAHRAASDQISENIPFGQPILVGHHSEARARRDAQRIRTNIDKSLDAHQGARDAQAAAARAERTASGTESIVTITNRIERNEALVRKVDRELAEHETAQAIIAKVGLDHPKVQAVGTDRLGLRSPERLAQLAQLKAEALDAIGHDRAKLEAAGGVTYGKHNVSPGDIIVSRSGGYTPVLRANAKTATVPTGYSWTDTIAWSKVTKVIPAEKFTPDQVRQILENTDPADRHRTAAFEKTLARAEQHMAASATWASAVDSFHHQGPGGDQALAQAHPELVAALRELPVGDEMTVAGHVVTRQAADAWAVDEDAHLASPWVVVQSIQAARSAAAPQTATPAAAANPSPAATDSAAAGPEDVTYVPVAYQHVDFARMPDGSAHRLTYDDTNPHALHNEIHAIAGDKQIGKVHWTPGYGNATVEVDPDHRRQGIGTQLMREAMASDPTAAQRWTPVTAAGQALGHRLGLDAPGRTESAAQPAATATPAAAAWAREEASLLDGLDVDAAARQRLSGRQGLPQVPAATSSPSLGR